MTTPMEFADPYVIAKHLVETVVLETARGRRCADVYIVNRDLDVEFTNDPQSELPWWSRPGVRTLMGRGPDPSAFEARVPYDRVVSIRPLDDGKFVVTIEPKRRLRSMR